MIEILQKNWMNSASELTKLRSEGAKGTLKKETASIRWTRRDIARIKTILTERVENN